MKCNLTLLAIVAASGLLISAASIVHPATQNTTSYFFIRANIILID